MMEIVGRIWGHCECDHYRAVFLWRFQPFRAGSLVCRMVRRMFCDQSNLDKLRRPLLCTVCFFCVGFWGQQVYRLTGSYVL